MPRVPQIEANRSPRIGPTSAEASMAAFDDVGAGMRVLSHGLGDVATAASQISAQQRHLEEKRRLDDEYKWLVDAEGQFKDEAREFTVNPENNGREDFGAITHAYLLQREKEYLKNAPSTRARTKLKDILQTQRDSRTAAAINIGEATKLRQAQRGLDENIYKAMTAFRDDAAVSPYYAEQNLEPTRKLLHESITARWGDTSKYAPALHEIIDEQIIKGTAPHSPDYARRVLQGSSYINEDKRVNLENHIESAETARGAESRIVMQQALEDRFANAEMTGTLFEMPADSAFNAFGKAKEAVKFATKQKADAYNKGLAIINDLRGKNAFSQRVGLAKASEGLTGEAGQRAREFAVNQLNKNQELQHDDKALWLRTNNSNVSSAFQRAGDTSDPKALEAAYNLQLQYQGPPPVGATPEEAAQYLDVPTGSQSLLTVPQAVQKAGMIRQGSLDQQVTAFRQLEAQFTNKKHWAIVYRDLVTLPPKGQGIDEGFQLGMLIKDPLVQKQYFASISNAQGVKELDDEKRGDFLSKIDGDQTWQKFQRSLIGDMQGGASFVAGYKEGIMKYARSFSLSGDTLANSVKKAVSHVISDNMWFAEVNGQTLAVPRYRENGTARTDEEIEDYGRRIMWAISELDPKSIKLRDAHNQPYFPAIESLEALKTDSVEYQQHLRRILFRNAFAVPEADGQSITLYIKGDKGVNGQIRDQNNQPFEAYLDGLKTWTTQGTVYGGGLGMTVVPPLTGTQKLPPPSADMIEMVPGRGSARIPGSALPSPLLINGPTGDTYRTNWPVTGSQWFRQIQKPGYQVPPGPTKAISP